MEIRITNNGMQYWDDLTWAKKKFDIIWITHTVHSQCRPQRLKQ